MTKGRVSVLSRLSALLHAPPGSCAGTGKASVNGRAEAEEPGAPEERPCRDRAADWLALLPPGLSDRPEQLAEVVRAARDAGADRVWANLLYLRPGTREHFLEQLARDWPEQLPRYEALYARGAYVCKDVKKPLQELVGDLRRRHGIRDRRTIRPELAREEQLALAV